MHRPVSIRSGDLLAVRAQGPSATSSTSVDDAYAQLMAALACDRPIAYSANLARVAGDAKAGLMLSQLLYWTRVGVEVEAHQGWIAKTREQWARETALSRSEQESARSTLVASGLIEECRVGMPGKLAYRVCLPRLSVALAELLNSEPVQWSLFDVRRNADQVRSLLGKGMAFYRAYAEVTGSVTAAVFIARAIQTQRVLAGAGRGLSDWFTFSPAGWAIDTGLTQAQLRTAKQKLCAANHLEQAQLLYPRRRSVLRVRLTELTAAVLQLRLNQMADGRPSGGLLELLGRELAQVAGGTGVNQEQVRSTKVRRQKDDFERPEWPVVSPGYGRPFWPNSRDGDGLNLAFTEPLDAGGVQDSEGPPNWQTVSAGYVAPDWRAGSNACASKPQEFERPEWPTVYGSITRPNWPDLSGVGARGYPVTPSLGAPDARSAADLPPEWRSDRAVDSAPDWRTNRQAEGLDARQASPANFANLGSENLPMVSGRISQETGEFKGLRAPATAGFDTSDGRFSQHAWLDLAALHARAGCLTTKETTPPPPTPSAVQAGMISANDLGGGGGRLIEGLPEPSPDSLVWPSLPGAVVEGLRRMLSDHRVARGLGAERLQLLLDELASTLERGRVRSPAAYLGAMLAKEARGELDLSAAYEWQARRRAAPTQGLPSITPSAKTRQLQEAAGPLPPKVAPIEVADPLAQSLWDECLHLLLSQGRISEPHLQLWLKPLKVALDQERSALLLCASRFKVDHIKAAYLPHIAQAWRQVLEQSAHATNLQPADRWQCLLVTALPSSLRPVAAATPNP